MMTEIEMLFFYFQNVIHLSLFQNNKKWKCYSCSFQMYQFSSSFLLFFSSFFHIYEYSSLSLSVFFFSVYLVSINSHPCQFIHGISSFFLLIFGTGEKLRFFRRPSCWYCFSSPMWCEYHCSFPARYLYNFCLLLTLEIPYAISSISFVLTPPH